MDREIVLAVLVVSLCGLLGLGGGLWPVRVPTGRSGTALERLGWARLWAPLLPAATVLALLIGWALREPADSEEYVRPAALLVAVPLAVVWLRAVVRAQWSIWRSRRVRGVATVGLFHPRVTVDVTFHDVADERAVAAACAHEAAHVRHHDPLRILLARLVTDLQWPLPAAPVRLRLWQHALELARDEEARRAGVEGDDLAAAIVVAAQLGVRSVVPAVGLLGEGDALRDRVDRLLAPLVVERDVQAHPGTRALLLAALLGVACAVGAVCGEAIVRALPGIST